MLLSVLSQKHLRSIVVFLQKTPDDEPLRGQTYSDILPKSAGVVNSYRPCPHLDRCDRCKLYHRQPGSKGTVSTVGEDHSNRIRSLLHVKEFGQSAGVEKVLHWLPMSALLNNQVAERTRITLQSPLHFFDSWRCWVSSFCDLGLATRQVLVVVTVIQWFDDQGDAFFVVERHALDRMEDAILVNGFNVNSHDFSLDDFLQEAY
jgi:hypothetical protein